MKLTAMDYGVEFEVGSYPVALKNIEQIESTFEDSDYFFAWEFEVTEGDYAGREISGSSSTNFGPRAKARQWAEALLGRKLNAGETIDTEDLLGLAGNAMVQLKDKGDRGTFPYIDNVYPLRKEQKEGEQAKSKGGKKAAEKKTEEEESFDEIPF